MLWCIILFNFWNMQSIFEQMNLRLGEGNDLFAVMKQGWGEDWGSGIPLRDFSLCLSVHVWWLNLPGRSQSLLWLWCSEETSKKLPLTCLWRKDFALAQWAEEGIPDSVGAMLVAVGDEPGWMEAKIGECGWTEAYYRGAQSEGFWRRVLSRQGRWRASCH